MSEDGYCGVSWPDVQAIVRIAGLRNGMFFHELEDHAQDAMERLLNARGPRGNDRKTVLAYAYKVSAHTAHDATRRATAHKRGGTVQLPDWDPALSCDESGYVAVEALDFLARLRPVDAQALMAAFLCGEWSEGGPGPLLGISDDAAHQRIHRARRAARLAA